MGDQNFRFKFSSNWYSGVITHPALALTNPLPMLARAAAGRGRTGARALSALARALPPPVAEADEAWRAVTGCMELPAVLRERALVLLRRRAGKERLGLRRMVAKHRPQPARQDAGLPFTRAMYSGERAPEGDAAGAGLTLVADRLPALYASALRPLIELRKRVPDFVPRTVLLHGAGVGAAAFAVRRAWPDHRPQVRSRPPPPAPRAARRRWRCRSVARQAY